MSHLKVKTTYSEQTAFGGTKTVELYCHHNLSADNTTFYNSKGEIQEMSFDEWDPGNDLWDAMNRLWNPFVGEWGKELKPNVEYYKEINHD